MFLTKAQMFFLKLKKVSSLFIVMACLTINTSAQSLHGKVLDDKDISVPFATVALLSATDSLILKGNVCNERGEFYFLNISSGNYIVKANSVGFESTYTPVFSYDSLAGLGDINIILNTQKMELGEVSVTVFKEALEFKDGMIVMNVENNVLISGNTVLDLLKKLPGVFIDNQNNIFLNGKSGVKIMIDGRLQQLSGQQLISVLSSMSSESVSKVEVINNPLVKYDASGSAGMINIVSKKIKILGYSGNVSGNLSKGKAYRASVDGALSYKARRITLFSNFGYADRTMPNTYIFDKTISLGGQTTFMAESGKQTDYQHLFYYKAGFDYIIDEKTIIGFLFNGGKANVPSEDIGVNKINGYNDLGYDHTSFKNYVNDRWLNPGCNFNAEHKFDTIGTTLNFSSDYSNYKENKHGLSENFFLNNYESEVLPSNIYSSNHITDIKIFTQKLDFKMEPSKSWFFETGLKNTYVINKNNYSFGRRDHITEIFVVDTAFSNNYEYRENIIAGYVSFRKQWKIGSLQAGGRAENTVVDARDRTSEFRLKRNYINFFPTITFDYPRSDNHNFQFTISRRIDRPSYKDLNPYKSYQDTYFSTIGNPYLLPQTVYNFSFIYTFHRLLYNTFAYSRYSNLVLSYDYQNDTTKETISAKGNLKSSDYYSYSLYIQKKISSWLNVALFGSVFYQNFTGVVNGTGINRNVIAFNSNANIDIALPGKFKLQLSPNYTGPSINGIQNFDSRWTINAVIKKTFLNENLSVNLSFLDIFHTDIIRVKSKFQNQDYLSISSGDTQRIYLYVNYKFGNVRIQKREVNSNGQEKGRLENSAQ